MASSLSDILSTIQNGVIALNNMAVQVKGSFTAILSRFVVDEANIATNTAAIAAMSAAWTAYTPTITSTAGVPTTVTAAGSYLTIGKLVHFIVLITVTDIGTSAGKWNLPLPVGSAVRAFTAMGSEIFAIGKVISYTVPSGTATGTVQAYDNATSLIVNTYSLNIVGLYEQA